MKKSQMIIGLLMVSLMAFQSTQGEEWRDILNSKLPVLGHRNWIVIADSAYPKQSAPGIETIYTGSSQIEVLNAVLEQVAQASHVQAQVMFDAELECVTEADAPGIDAYRKALDQLLQDKKVTVMPHEEIIGKLDKDAEVFNILLLKTDMTIPYTSVFLQLDCGYWDASKEARLRKNLQNNQ